MAEVDLEELLGLLDDALDEIESGMPGLYTEDELAAYLLCFEHWQQHGELTEADVAFLDQQLHDYTKEDSDHA